MQSLVHFWRVWTEYVDTPPGCVLQEYVQQVAKGSL